MSHRRRSRGVFVVRLASALAEPSTEIIKPEINVIALPQGSSGSRRVFSSSGVNDAAAGREQLSDRLLAARLVPRPHGFSSNFLG
jgi:hypothetical protein